MKQPLELTSYKYSSTVFNSWESLASLVTMDETTDQIPSQNVVYRGLKYTTVFNHKKIYCAVT